MTWQIGHESRYIVCHLRVHESLRGDRFSGRRLAGRKARAQEFRDARNQEIATWVEEHPEIKAKVEERIKNVPAENRKRSAGDLIGVGA